ncbi:VCBS domain-containing protein [Vibrio sp. ABG19]|uniref:VCBS domain-containing protein n=1 Tax=Vibrio sp. ABG19 TaxID=2817385 RepID=UPI00249F8C64|nr:VCBS domain-containing protein [Vibrio sp. ABG19]WGY47098.1 VCBS domain-containing protein [Vibrio sp. ABG19]
MNTRTLASTMLANVTLIIDRNGQFREQAANMPLRPGDVVVQVSEGPNPQVTAELVSPANTANTNLDGEIAQIIQQLELGADPTQNPDLATAAGGTNGSSLTTSASISRTGDEVLASTSFDTSGLEGLGLSATQSLALTDLVADTVTTLLLSGSDSAEADETDEPVTLEGVLQIEGADGLAFIAQQDVAGDYGQFSIDADGNWVFVANSAFDELNTGDSIVDQFQVVGTDGSTHTVTVTINGTNDVPVFVDVNDAGDYSFSYDEGQTEGQTIGQVSAIDPDNEVLAFSIKNNVQDEQGNDLFQINSETGEISLTAAGVASLANDYELPANTHGIVVTVTEVDGNGTPQSADVDVILSERDIDDNAPVFNPNDPDNPDGAQYAFEYNENSTVNDVLGTVQATDADGEEVTYSIKQNVFDGDNNALFTIDATTGAIRLTDAGVAAFANDFELDPNEHKLMVTATEVAGLGEQQSTDIPVALSELNLDDNAPVFNPNDPDNPDGAQYAFEYNENSTVNDVLGTVQATDADGEEVTYSIKQNVFDGDNNALFTIDAESGEIRLTDAGVAAFANDFELDPNEHKLMVTATEVAGLGEQQSTDIPVALSELNLDDNAPVFNPNDPDNPDGAQYAFEYNENSTVNDVLGTVQATDADGEEVTYSIKQNVFDGDNNALFTIDATTGAIRLTDAGVAAFANDFELDPNEHKLMVTATEVAGLGEQQSTDIPVALSELNLDDNAPVFNPNDPDNPDGAQYAFEYNENSTVNDVLGTVQATDADGEEVTYSIKQNVFDGDNNALFTIDATTGEIRLTDAGVAAFANDFELDPNEHKLMVTATEVVGLGEQQSTDIPVALTELNLDDNAPVFDPNDPDENRYVFDYYEGRVITSELGRVSASDADGERVTYSITQNVYFNGMALFAINAVTGVISLTSEGVAAFTNNYELATNTHNLVVTATEDEGLGMVKSTDIEVILNELNIDDAPIAENFTVLLSDNVESTIVFDSDDPQQDHISDIDDDAAGIQVMIVLTSLPETGTLLYTDEFGVTRELTNTDLYVEGGDKVLLDPHYISFVPSGDEVVIGSSEDGSLTDNNDGTYTFTLENGNQVEISATKVNGNRTVASDVDLINHNTQGTGFSVEGGGGINTTETLTVDFSDNPFYKISFAVDGLNNNHVATVTFTFLDGSTHVEYYDVNQADYSYVSSQPIVQMDFSASSNDATTGSNYVVTYLSGSEVVTEDTSFNYMAVDSDDQLSNQATVTLDADSTTPSFDVVIGEDGEPIIHAQMGNDLLIGYGGQADVFTWLDAALDNSTDVVKNFERGSDTLDLTSVLSDDETFNDLLAKISIDEVESGDEDLTLRVDHDGGEQTIIIENGVDIFDITGALDTDTANAILNQIVKNDTV